MKDGPRELSTSLGLLLLRLGMGGYMATHGWGKVEMIRRGDAFGSFIGLSETASLYLATFAEFACALLVALGLGTRLAALPVAFTMGVAAFVAHAADPWTAGRGAELFFSGRSAMWSSKEPALVYLIGFLALAFTGGGRFALDALIFRKRRGRR